MMLTIRPAAQTDLPAIAQLTAAAFAERIFPQSDHLQDNQVLVAQLAGAVVGYAASFLTRSAMGEARYELDLLAVDSAARGRGVGCALLARCIQAASASGVDSLRALVRVDNCAMSRLCAGAGLLPSASPVALMIAAPKPAYTPARATHAAHLLSVNTLTYRGIWLEGALSQAAIAQAHQRARAENRSRIGALLAVDALRAAALLRENGFVSVGEFTWWSLKLRSAPA